MKKANSLTLFTITLWTICTSTYAQSLQLGITAGLQQSHPKGYNSMLGFNIGAEVLYNLSSEGEGTYFDLAATLSSKGWKDFVYTSTVGNERIPWKCHLYYIEVPVHIGYKTNISETTRLFADIGPYFAIGLYGKCSFGKNDNDILSENPYPGNLFTNGTYKRFDTGMGTKVGIEYDQKIQFAIGYKFSFSNPIKGNLKAFNPKDKTLFASMAYLF